MEEKGIVVENRDQMILVKIERHSACSKCDRQCGLAAEPEKEETVVEIEKDADRDFTFQTGQQVILEMEDKNLVFSAFFVYIFPLLAMIGGYFLFAWLLKGENWGIAGSLLGLAAGFGFVKFINLYLEQSGDFEPRIKKVITNKGVDKLDQE